jgi:hypothetical protein
MSEESASAGATPQEQEPDDRRERLVEIRCGFAEMAQREADAAAARVAEARHHYEQQAAALVKARSQVDPGVTQTAKEAARSSFRAAVASARSRGQVEAAAVAWLADINRINSESRAALVRIERGHAAVGALEAQLAGLYDTAEAEAAMAAAATEACRAARAALGVRAAAQLATAPTDGAWTPEVAELAAKAAERAAEAGTSAAAQAPLAATPPVPADSASTPVASVSSAAAADPSSPNSLFIDLTASRPQVIVRLMRRDGKTMSALVDRLAGGDSVARSVWQLNLSNFVDAVVAAAIDDACFEFSRGNPFWDQFSATESREIAHGLAALGYRYDGFEGFVDGRVPAQRDLALALGQVGVLPVKVRHWPSAEEAAQLFRGVAVSGDRFIAVRAPALTLGELVKLLGRRAELLADLWNDWPRCRALLFSTGF